MADPMNLKMRSPCGSDRANVLWYRLLREISSRSNGRLLILWKWHSGDGGFMLLPQLQHITASNFSEEQIDRPFQYFELHEIIILRVPPHSSEFGCVLLPVIESVIHELNDNKDYRVRSALEFIAISLAESRTEDDENTNDIISLARALATKQ